MIAIDLGSNTLRAVVVDCQSGKILHEFERVVKTAEELNRFERISQGAKERIILGLKILNEKILFSNHEVLAFTTEAMRRAKNADEVLKEIDEQTGVLFEIINADKEASLTVLAVQHRLTQLRKDPKSFSLVDLGGGSTEVVFVENSKIIQSTSFPIGIVTAADAYTTQEAFINYCKVLVQPIAKMATEYKKSEVLVATAGTATTVAAFLQDMDYQTYDKDRINGFELTKEMLHNSLNDLLALDESERIRYVGVGRESLILAGIILLEEIFNALNHSSSIVIDDGLREGMVRLVCNE
jgi:exopolyphosphatase/guanosine-5'-triphosphate,3'-diphosphate pyrophosphatase